MTLKDPFAPLDVTDEMIFAALDERPLPKHPSEKKPRKPYDPGKPQGIHQVGPGVYEVASFRNPEKEGPYTADLHSRSCNCPHYKRRLAGTGDTCKHLDHAAKEARRLALLKAFVMPLQTLEQQTKREDLRPEIADVIRRVYQTRQAARSGYARV